MDGWYAHVLNFARLCVCVGGGGRWSLSSHIREGFVNGKCCICTSVTVHACMHVHART